MTFKEMSNPHLKTRPKFYEDHAKLIQQTLLEPKTIALYLNENMLQFYGDIEDVAECSDIYSQLDGSYSRLEYQYGNQQYLYEIENLNSLVSSMAITECNWHGADKKDKKAQMVQMEVPQFYELMRNLRVTKATIKDQVKEKQIFENKLFSEDLLIRSSRENQRNVLPFMSFMAPFIHYN